MGSLGGRIRGIDIALAQTSLDAERDVLGDRVAEAGHVLALEREPVAHGGAHDGGVQAEEGLGRGLDAGVLVGERGHERRVAAVRVEFGVQGALREEGHLQRDEGVGDGTGAAFQHELRRHATVDEDVELGAARVRVRRVEAARAKESNRHGATGAHERRKGYAVGANGGAAQSRRGAGVGRRIDEIEDEVAVLGNHADAVDGFWGEEE